MFFRWFQFNCKILSKARFIFSQKRFKTFPPGSNLLMCLTHCGLRVLLGVSCILGVQIYQACGCGECKSSSQSSRCKDQSDLDVLLLYPPRVSGCTCPWRQQSDIGDLVIFQGLNPVVKFCGRSWAKPHRSGTNRPLGPIKNERKHPKNSPLCCKLSMASLGICHKRLLLKLGLKCFESLWCFKEYRCKPEFISFYSEGDLSSWQWNILQDMKQGVNLHALNKHIYVY